MRARIRLPARDAFEDQSGRELADLAHRLMDGGERRVDVRGDRNVVVADDGYVVGDAQALEAQAADGAEGDQVALREDRGERNAAREQTVGCHTAALETPVGAVLDELRRFGNARIA